MQVGDLVRHKNHPIMGVVLEIGDIEGYRHVRCVWDDDGDACWVIDWLVIPCK